MIFPYSTALAEDADSGDFLVFRRPEVTVRIAHAGAAIAVDGLVDTGSDLTIFPLSLAKQLGIAVTPAREGTARVFGGQPVGLFTGMVVLELVQGEVLRWKDYVWFCDFGQPKDQTVVLGHAGFLDYFLAEFDGRASVLRLTPNDELPRVD